MSKKLKFTTLEEFMKTMKRRGTADSVGYKQDVPSPSSFRKRMMKLEESSQKQRLVIKMQSTQLRSSQGFSHYYIQEGTTDHVRSPVKIGSSQSISIASDQCIKDINLKEIAPKQTFQKQNNQHFNVQKSLFNSAQLIKSQREIADPAQVREGIIDDINKLYCRQRFHSPPQQKRDLDNLQDYFRKSRNYQTMNHLIRKNSCECNNCGGRCYRIQAMKGVIPHFIPRQVIRDSLRKKWKKASKTLRKLCLFFKQSAADQAKTKNYRIFKKKYTNAAANNSIVISAISAMSNQVSFNSPSNENVRQILSSDPLYPPFLNLKGSLESGGGSHTYTQIPSQLSIQESPTNKISQFKKKDTLNISNNSIQNKDESDKRSRSSSSSDFSLKNKELFSPQQLRKALNKVDDNFLQELTQQRKNGRQKSRKITNVLIRNDSKKRIGGQSMYNTLNQQKSLKISSQQQQLQPPPTIKQQQQPQQEIKTQSPLYTTYQRFLEKPHPKLVDIVSQRGSGGSKTWTSSSQNNLTKSQGLNPKYITKSSYSSQLTPQSVTSKAGSLLENQYYSTSQFKSVKKNISQTDRKKSSELIQIEDNPNQSIDSFRQMHDNFDQLMNSQTLKRPDSSNGNSLIFNMMTSRKNFEDSVLSKSTTRKQYQKFQKNIVSISTQNMLDVYKGHKRSSTNKTPQNHYSNSPSQDKLNQNNPKKISIKSNLLNTIILDPSNKVNAVYYFEQEPIKGNQTNKDQKLTSKNEKPTQSPMTLKIFNKDEIKSMQKDIQHLRVRSLNLCQSQTEYQNNYFTKPMKHIRSFVSPFQDNNLLQVSQNSLTKNSQNFPSLSLSQSKTFRDEEGFPPSSILKRQNLKNSQSNNIRFQM